MHWQGPTRIARLWVWKSYLATYFSAENYINSGNISFIAQVKGVMV